MPFIFQEDDESKRRQLPPGRPVGDAGRQVSEPMGESPRPDFLTKPRQYSGVPSEEEMRRRAEAERQAYESYDAGLVFQSDREYQAMSPEQIRELSAFERGGVAFKRQLEDTLTFGIPTAMGDVPQFHPEQEAAFGTAGTVGSFVGFAAGELPIFLAGGAVLGPVLKRVVGRQIVKNIGKGVTSKFGKRAVRSLKDPYVIAESATAIGIDTIREAIKASGLEKDFEVTGVTGRYGERIAFNIVAPFLGGLLKRTKTAATKPRAEASILRPTDPLEVFETAGEYATGKQVKVGEIPAKPRPLVPDEMVNEQVTLALLRHWEKRRDAGLPDLGTIRKGSDGWIEALTDRLNLLQMVRRLKNTAAKGGVDGQRAQDYLYDSRSRKFVRDEAAKELTPEQLTEQIAAVQQALGQPIDPLERARPILQAERKQLHRLKRAGIWTNIDDKVEILRFLGAGEGYRYAGQDLSPENRKRFITLMNLSQPEGKMSRMGYAARRGLLSTTGALSRMGPAGEALAGRLLDARLAWVIDAGTAMANILPNIKMYRPAHAFERSGQVPIRRGFGEWISGRYEVRATNLKNALGDVIPEEAARDPHYSRIFRRKTHMLDQTEERLAEVLKDEISKVRKAYDDLPEGTYDPDNFKELNEFLPENWRTIPAKKLGMGKMQRGLENFFQHHYQNISKVKNLRGSLAAELVEGRLPVNTFLPLLAHLRNRALEVVEGRKKLFERLAHEKPSTVVEDFQKAQTAIASRQDLLKRLGRAEDDIRKELIFTEGATSPEARRIAGEVADAAGLGETAKELIFEIERTGYDAHFAKKAYETYMGLTVYHPTFVDISRKARTINVWTELGLAVIDNMLQPAFTAGRFGTWNTLAEMANTFRSATKDQSLDFATRSGAVLQDVTRISELEIGGDWSSGFLRATLFSSVESWNRQVTANAGRRYVTDLLVELGENAGQDMYLSGKIMGSLHRLGFTTRHLKRYASEMGLTPEGKILVGQLVKANNTYKFSSRKIARDVERAPQQQQFPKELEAYQAKTLAGGLRGQQGAHLVAPAITGREGQYEATQVVLTRQLVDETQELRDLSGQQYGKGQAPPKLKSMEELRRDPGKGLFKEHDPLTEASRKATPQGKQKSVIVATFYDEHGQPLGETGGLGELEDPRLIFGPGEGRGLGRTVYKNMRAAVKDLRKDFDMGELKRYGGLSEGDPIYSSTKQTGLPPGAVWKGVDKIDGKDVKVISYGKVGKTGLPEGKPPDSIPMREQADLEIRPQDMVVPPVTTVDPYAAWDTPFAKMMGFQSSRATQFLGDLLDNPLFTASPHGKMIWQFKTFMYNTVRFMYRDVIKEAGQGIKHGDISRFKPLATLVIAGALLGEPKESVKDIAQLRDPLQRGRDVFFGFDKRRFPNWFRRLIGNQPMSNDKDIIQALATAWETDSQQLIMRRAVENFLSMGALGLFQSVAHMAVYGGKEAIAFWAGGPSAAKTSTVPMQLLDMLQNWDKPGHWGELGKMLPIVGPAISAYMDPSEFQKKRGLFNTPFDKAVLSVKRSNADMADIREEILDIVEDSKFAKKAGLHGEAKRLRDQALALAGKWNRHGVVRLKAIPPRYYEILAKKAYDDTGVRKTFRGLFTFGAPEIRRMMRGRVEEETTDERLRDLEMRGFELEPAPGLVQ